MRTGLLGRDPAGIAVFRRRYFDWLLAEISAGRMVFAARPDPGFVTSSGGAVSALADRAGGSDPFAQSSGLSKPTLTANWVNGVAALAFSGSKVMTTSSVHCPSSNYSWGGVFECTSTAASRCPFALGTTGAPSYTIESGAHTVRYLGGSNCVDGSSLLTSRIDVVITRATGITGATTMYINGVARALTPSAVAQGTPSGGLVLGALDSSKTFAFAGNVGEVWIRTGVLSAADVAARYYGYSSPRYII